MSYKPQPGSVAWKVIEFFTTNPDEAMTPEDIGIKFDKPGKQVHSLLAQAVESGALTRKTNSDGELEYSLGTGVPEIKAAPGRAQSHRQSHDAILSGGFLAQRAPQSRPKEPLQIDMTAIPIESGIPLPIKGQRKRTDWTPLLSRLEPGSSCVLPIRAKFTLGAAITAFKKSGKGLLAMRKISDTELRLWRIA